MTEDTPNIPIKSHHCTTTHSACECVLERLRRLEKVLEMAKEIVLYTEIEEIDEVLFAQTSPILILELEKAFENLERE